MVHIALEPPPVANGAAIKAIRQARGWRTNAFARAIDISPSYLSNIEAGRKGALPETLDRIAAALGVPVAAISSTTRPNQP